MISLFVLVGALLLGGTSCQAQALQKTPQRVWTTPVGYNVDHLRWQPDGVHAMPQTMTVDRHLTARWRQTLRSTTVGFGGARQDAGIPRIPSVQWSTTRQEPPAHRQRFHILLL